MWATQSGRSRGIVSAAGSPTPGISPASFSVSLMRWSCAQKAELHRRQQHHAGHQDNGLGRGRPEIEINHPIAIHLDHQRLRRLCRTALGQRPDGSERVECRVGQVDDHQEEAGGRQQREGDGAEPAPAPRAVHPGGLDHRARDGLQPGQEEDEIVADLLPGAGDHDHEERLAAVDIIVPADTVRVQPAPQQPHLRIEYEQPQHRRNDGRDGIGPDQQRAIDGAPAYLAVGERGEQQRRGSSTARSHRHRTTACAQMAAT